jgi:hypothetical protein
MQLLPQHFIRDQVQLNRKTHREALESFFAVATNLAHKLNIISYIVEMQCLRNEGKH